MTGSSATDVCLSAGAACISFLCSPCTATDLPSGECGGKGQRGFVCTQEKKRDRQTEGERAKESERERKRMRRATARVDAHCHMLSYTHWCIASMCTQRHTHTLTHTHAQTSTHTRASYTLTHLASQEAMRPVGQSKLESLVRLFTSNYRNRTISATTAPAFLYSYRGREGGK